MSPEKVLFFTGEYGFLSNFYKAPTRYEGILYPTSEHAFQAAKSTDVSVRRQVAELPTAGDAKRYGRRKIKLRAGWDKMKISVMRDVLRAKFSTSSQLKERLVATGDIELIEGNDWGDNFWGKVGSTGENWLGRLLMEVRDELRSGSNPVKR